MCTAILRRARRRRPDRERPRRLRHLLVRVRSRRGGVGARGARGALRRQPHVRRRRVRRGARARGRGHPRRHGQRVRDAHVAAAAAPAPRRFRGRRRARLRDHVGGRAVPTAAAVACSPSVAFTANAGLLSPGHSFSVLTQRHMHLYGTKREHFAEVAISQRENAIRRPETALQTQATVARRVLRGADDLRAALPVRLHAGDRRRGRGDHDVGRSGQGPQAAAGVHPVVGARRHRPVGAGDLPLLPGARRRVRVVGAPPGGEAPLRDGGHHARPTSTSRCSTTTSRRS